MEALEDPKLKGGNVEGYSRSSWHLMEKAIGLKFSSNMVYMHLDNVGYFKLILEWLGVLVELNGVM